MRPAELYINRAVDTCRQLMSRHLGVNPGTELKVQLIAGQPFYA
jgi:hypothetical protein